MTKYEEMCEAADNARKNFIALRQRSWKYFAAIINTLETHCGIPAEKFEYLKWDAQHGQDGQFSGAGEGLKYALPGATEYDEREGFWTLGVLITLTPDRISPKQWVFFSLFIKEQNENPFVKIGATGQGQTVLLDDEGARKEFCESIVERVVKTFSEPKVSSRPIGFSVGQR